MNIHPLIRAGVLTLVLVTVFIAGWEVYCRSQGFETFYDDNDALWADKRAKVYTPSDKATVFIGSSRIKFDLDIPTWEKISGEEAVQLAIVGSSPRPVLEDLANDENFKGKLLIDVTEPLFFSIAPPYNSEPTKYVSYYQNRTPTQRFSFSVNHLLESQLAFLNKKYLSNNALLGRMPLPRRPDVFVFPYFPPQFERTSFDRQCIMADAFVRDTNLQKQMQQNWIFLGEAGKKLPSPNEQQIEEMFTSVKNAVHKIKERGGSVLFVRTPSSNPMWGGEQMGFPREKFWDRLLQVTDTEGIHFSDYKETSGFICPEWSHLRPADAIVYTHHLMRHMEEKGWRFPNKAGAPSQFSSR